jgi:hypothetical protein
VNFFKKFSLKGFKCFVEGGIVNAEELKTACELSNKEEGLDYGTDVAYPIDDILD